MNPVQIIEKAKSLGVSLYLTDKHSIRFKGESKSIVEVMPLLQTHKAELIQWLKFCNLYAYVAIKGDWVDADSQQWCKDLAEQPELTMECLRALRHSWDRGGYGCLTLADWLSEETKTKTEASFSKSATNLLQMSNSRKNHAI
jgi:hypothetical protein